PSEVTTSEENVCLSPNSQGRVETHVVQAGPKLYVNFTESKTSFFCPLLPDHGGDQQDYKAHMVAKLKTSVEVHHDSPDIQILLDAFKPDQKGFQPHTVVLHGKSGIGKSALARRIVLGWAQGELYQDMFSYIIVLSTREMKWTEESSFAKLIAREWPNSQAPVAQIMSQPERLLFVVDSFDDLDSTTIHDDTRLCGDWNREQLVSILMYSLLKKALLPESFLMILTRDTGLEKLKSAVVSPQYILVEGMSCKERTQLLLSHIASDHRKAQVFHSVMDNHQLFDQCQIPSVCLLVCEALQLQERLGRSCAPCHQTLTGLYTTFVFHQLTPRDPFQSCLSQEERVSLMGLCRMAVEGVWNMRSVFYSNDLRSHGLKESELRALFHMNILLHEDRGERCFTFFHLSLQDFCAALYYVLEGLERWDYYFLFIKNLRGITELQQTGSNAHLLRMKQFLFGLVNKDTMKALELLLGRPVSPAVKQKLWRWVSLLGQQVNTTSTQVDVLNAFHYLYETQDKEFVSLSLNSFQEVWLTVSRRMDLMVSSFCLQHCQNLRKIRVDVKDIFSVDKTAELCPMAPQRTERKALIVEWWENFCSVLGSHPNLEQLHLGSSILSEWAMKTLCIQLRHPACKIQNLTFKSAEVAPGLQYLWMTLISNRNLKYLNLGSTLLREEDVKMACNALRHPKCFLETLRLDSCELSNTCYPMVSQLLNSSTSLKSLSLARNKVAEDSMKSLCDALMSSKCGLQRLILDSCDLKSASFHVLSSALLSNRKLTHLCLSNNDLGTEEMRLLCQSLRHPGCTLQRLILNDCNLRGQAYGFLALTLMNNTQLTHLSLTMNPVEDSGMKLLCEAIREPTCHLQDLELVHCQLTGNCCKDLACVITRNKYLRSLDLGANALGDSGVVALCEGLKQRDSHLRRLGLEACRLTSDCCQELSSALSCNQHLISLNLVRNDFSTSGMMKLCSAFMHPTSNLWMIGLWKKEYHAQVRRQLEELQLLKPHMMIKGDWYSFDEDDRCWWKN
uniref:NLR family, pyrin domain containing 5 n=1 Tax=Nannospalax galili TaxID=1026970 RepID=A0A8C6RES9_NANGA